MHERMRDAQRQAEPRKLTVATRPGASFSAETAPPVAFEGNQAALRRLSTDGRCIQCKLEVGAVDDPLEAEADRTAERVMRMSEPDVRADTQGVVRRSPETRGKSKPAERTNGSRAQFKRDAPPEVDQALRSPGQPLAPATQEFFGQRFGRDFRDVRVHTDASATESAIALRARAYAAGNDLVFAPGRYQPDNESGRLLLAHELAHVVQQETGVLRRQTEDATPAVGTEEPEAQQNKGQKPKYAARPSSQSVWTAYQNVGYMKWKGEDQKIEVWKFIGGRVGKMFQKKHSCAARVSYALNYGGSPIAKFDNDKSFHNDSTSDFEGKAGDDKNYVVGAPGMGDHMAANYGPPDANLKEYLDFLNFRNALDSDQSAIFAGSGHCGMITKYGYTDPYIASELPVKVWKLGMP